MTLHNPADEIPGDAAQQRFWNEWNSNYRGEGYDPTVDPATMRRRDTVIQWIRQLGLNRPRILDLGCATGWLTVQLAELGEVVGTDLADASIREARQRYPHIPFECADFSKTNLPNGAFDIVVSLETLSHVADQGAFLERVSEILKPGGYLILTTQNRFVFERRADVMALAEGQIRHWVSPGQLRRLLRPKFTIRRFTTLMPEGHLGILHLVNSAKLNHLLGRFVSPGTIQRTKEMMGIGQTIAVLAQRS
jgi:2-polyprenyl-3-methyl-5-hydroxy-6-metoxy-1,4-benzoquinol methylase